MSDDNARDLPGAGAADFDGACDQLVELVTEYLEGALSPSTAAAVEEHLAECDGCLTYIDQMRATITATGRLGAETISPTARTVLLDTFRELLPRPGPQR